MVECSGLENRRTLIAFPGFDSLVSRRELYKIKGLDENLGPFFAFLLCFSPFKAAWQYPTRIRCNCVVAFYVQMSTHSDASLRHHQAVICADISCLSQPMITVMARSASQSLSFAPLTSVRTDLSRDCFSSSWPYEIGVSRRALRSISRCMSVEV